MKKLKIFQKLKFNSSISSSASTSTNSSSSCIQKDDVNYIEEKSRMLIYEQENRVPKIQMRVKRSDTGRMSQNRFSAIGSINSSSQQNMIHSNKRYSTAADFNAKEITYIYKVLIIGNSAVGKTSLMNRFCNNTFMPNYIDTIGVDFKTKIIKLAPDFVNDIRQQKSKAVIKRNSSIIQNNNINSFDDQALRVKLQIWDTTGAQRFQSIALNYYRGANGILIVYDVNDRKSFESVKKWMKQVSDYCTDKAEVCLVANKCDKNERIVTKLEGETLAAMYGLRYIETSAKANINIERTFTELTKNIRKKLDLVTQLQSKTEEMSKERNQSFKTRTHRKFSKIFNTNPFISCFVCNSRQLSENT
jgi:small GTP-binding protein